nr:hypothetical protein [uncultured Pedobacter sp.]
METIEQKYLAAELHELYLQNNEWLSDLAFLEDEMRFFKKLFNKVITLAIHESSIEKLYPVNNGLAQLSEKRKQLKEMVVKHKNLLTSLIKDQSKTMGMELLNNNAHIAEEIKSLFAEDQQVRKNLYVLSENVFDEESKHHLLTK